MQGFYWKQVKSQRAKILISMCVAIGFTDIFAILEGVARDNSVCLYLNSGYLNKETLKFSDA